MPMAMTKLSRPISAYLRENVHYTFSGFNFTPTFLDLMLQVGVEVAAPVLFFPAGARAPEAAPGSCPQREGYVEPGRLGLESRRTQEKFSRNRKNLRPTAVQLRQIGQGLGLDR